MTRPTSRCPGCIGCAAASTAAKPTAELASRLTALAVVMFGVPLAALLLLATLLSDAGPALVVLALGCAAAAWMLLLRWLRPWIDRRLIGVDSELPRVLLVREGATQLTRSQS